MQPQNRAVISIIISHLAQHAGNRYTVDQLLRLNLPAVSAWLKGPSLHSHATQLGRALAQAVDAGLIVDGFALVTTAPTPANPRTYRAQLVESPPVVGVDSDDPAVLLAAISHWQIEGQRLRDRVVAMAARGCKCGL